MHLTNGLQTNRVIRGYEGRQDCFVRVDFSDEEGLSLRFDRGVAKETYIRTRVAGVLKKGLTIARIHHDFLLWSNSSLKEHSVWYASTTFPILALISVLRFCRPFRVGQGTMVTAASIRGNIGDVKHLEEQPSRYVSPEERIPVLAN